MPALRATSLRHVRPVVPLRFPAEEPEAEHLGQGKKHLELCVALYQMIGRIVGDEHAKGADQFVYFDAADPRRCLAPDAFVKLGVRDSAFETWKTWESGAPDVAFEVLSPSDTPERWTFREKLKRYRALGVRELIVANLDAPSGKRLRAWDRIDGDLVERIVKNDRTPCVTLGVHLLIGPIDRYPVGLRVARDAMGEDRVLTPAEGERVAQERERLAQERERAAQERERAAQARVAELEAALKSKRRKK